MDEHTKLLYWTLGAVLLLLLVAVALDIRRQDAPTPIPAYLLRSSVQCSCDDEYHVPEPWRENANPDPQ